MNLADHLALTDADAELVLARREALILKVLPEDGTASRDIDFIRRRLGFPLDRTIFALRSLERRGLVEQCQRPLGAFFRKVS